MGVDVTLYAIGHVTESQLREAEAFVAARTEKDPFYDTCLERAPRSPLKIEFNTLSRYYGPGYERGHWPTIHNMIVTLRAALPHCTVHYGGDTWDDTPMVTDDSLAEIWKHYLGPKAFNYFDRSK